MKARELLPLLFLAVPAAAFAQTLTGIRVEPEDLKVGDRARITVTFTTEGAINCGMRLHFGDGTSGDYKINQQKDLNLVVERTYSKPGDIAVVAEPKTVGTLLKCSGKAQNAKFTVAALPPPPAPAPPPGAAKSAAESKPVCPEGWKLDSKSVNKKTGAFTCVAKPGTLVTSRVTCPGNLGYFENEKKGVLGCRP